ncbi:Na(+)/H(+) exchange regulatory cofactor NHE-RF1 [Copidosoma floridanum]|uniref:Na(+)/H(+) exchange regulatory cofactor NHE-RF1 n=1 Tax=Copidosoma floridanum TaxID=29053 RepID=UPI0006C9CBE5|nr:Na(+)/H(+) exchange regulatory cofactor NHE-RF1 [Copidosoma floridanum]
MESVSPRARLCHITKWEHFDGYGFNLHAEKGKIGQFIGKVDEGSPSEAAGLRQGDRIIEVNEINIANETHKQVVERIKAFPTETKLLVVDRAADDYFKANNVPIKGTMPGIKYLKTPESSFTQDDEDEIDNDSRNGSHAAAGNANKTTSNGSQGTTSDTHSIGSSVDGGKENGSANNGTLASNGSNSMTTQLEDEDNLSNKSSASGGSKDVIQPAGSGDGPLNLQMSAKELRAKLAARKKYDPKKTPMGFKDKFDIVQKL